MNNIHPTAIVSKKAGLCDNITIGPYAIIEDDVEIGNNCFIGPHAVIYDGARIGNNVRIYQGTSVSHIPQDLKFDGAPTQFIIGDNTTIHENATLHRGTHATGKSSIGSNCLLMAYTHVAHDCEIGNNCVIANSVQIGGHAHIEDWVTIGGCTPVHQFSKVGQHAMIGGGFRIIKDIPPFILAANEPLSFCGLNVIGLRRRGFSNEDIETLKNAYHILYQSGLNFSQAKEKMKVDYDGHKLVRSIIDFIDGSKRGIINK